MDGASGAFDREALRAAFVGGDAQVRRGLLAVERAQRATRAAGRLPDPELSLQALYLDFDADDPWFLAGALEFALPFLSTRDQERDAARADERRAIAELADATRDAGLDAEQLWLDAWAAEAQRRAHHWAAEEYDELAQLVDLLSAAGESTDLVARHLRLTGLAQRSNAMAHERDLAGHRARAAARLDRAAPIEFDFDRDSDPARFHDNGPHAPHTDTQESPPDPNGARLDPLVAIAVARLDAAQARLEATVRGAFDGASLGPSGEWEDGEARYGLALSLPLPITGRRAALRAVAEIVRREAALELELAAAEVDARRTTASLELEIARRELALVEQDWAPLAQEQLDATRELFEIGEVDANAIAAAIDACLEAELARIAAFTRAERARAQLDALGTSRPAVRAPRETSHGNETPEQGA